LGERNASSTTFFDLEFDFVEKQEKLLKTVESQAKQLNEMKKTLVSIFILKLNVIKP